MCFDSTMGLSAFGDDEKDTRLWLVFIFSTEMSTDAVVEVKASPFTACCSARLLADAS